ncbi:MAG TPA: cytochrome c oxidase assembly protein [Caulobacteraceae bacterium]|nr:cytochrome c oxidase assembly protein [Caulobacteraceae bacterium]
MDSERRLRTRNGVVAGGLAVLFIVMVGAAFAFVPLYHAFCEATGFNGTVRRAFKVNAVDTHRTVVVHFDTNVRGLPWDFEPDVESQTAEVGEAKLAFFRVTNHSSQPLTGRAVYNVAPESVGGYFSKLQCFCFQAETIPAGVTEQFPVVYFIDPRFGTDDDTKGVSQITLSYTFYPARSAADAPA